PAASHRCPPYRGCGIRPLSGPGATGQGPQGQLRSRRSDAVNTERPDNDDADTEAGGAAGGGTDGTGGASGSDGTDDAGRRTRSDAAPEPGTDQPAAADTGAGPVDDTTDGDRAGEVGATEGEP